MAPWTVDFARPPILFHANARRIGVSGKFWSTRRHEGTKKKVSGSIDDSMAAFLKLGPAKMGNPHC
jgi:hypothetical protein